MAGSRLALDPVPATILVEAETRRRDRNIALGSFSCGCSEIDDYALLGGLERGSIVGLSAEVEEFGITVLAHGLCNGKIQKALIITPPPTTAILVPLRDAIAAQLAAAASLEKKSDEEDDRRRRKAKTMQCLDKVMLSTVLDVDGVREVFVDLGRNVDRGNAPAPEPEPVLSKTRQEPEPEPEPISEPITEIQDSQDEEDDSLDGDSVRGPPEPQHHQPRQPSPPPPRSNTYSQQQPDFIVITHFYTLLTGLFTHRSSPAAHSFLHELSSRLRRLSRTLPSSPLILLLNTTSSSSDKGVDAATSPRRGKSNSPFSSSNRSIDPTLRSIFNPPPPTSVATGSSSAAAAAMALSRRNKPSFGLVFSQLLELHLLCTRVPRSEADADAVFAAAATMDSVDYATVVEVLLDEMGVWERTREGQDRQHKKRRSREQRWAAVQVRGGLIRNAFREKKVAKVYSNVTLAAGFGGPRV